MIEGIKERLQKAMDEHSFIQITFKYPDFTKRIFKKGYVTKIFDDSFNFDEKFDGHATFSYDFIIEIVRWGK